MHQASTAADVAEKVAAPVDDLGDNLARLYHEGVDGIVFADAEGVIRAANERVAPHQRIRGFTVWPDDDLPRTHTLKVKKQLVLARLPELTDPAAATPAGGGGTRRAAADAQPRTPDWAGVLALPGAHLHLYGKLRASRGRKMGHLTLTGATQQQVQASARQAAQMLGIALA